MGFTHDNGSNLIGENTGLTTLLNKAGNKFFDLCDPCHGLHLSMKHSIKEMPANIEHFIHSVAYDFAFPKKKALLRKIQEESGYKVLYPKQIAPTRWLSLGESLLRIIQIWDSLIKFYDSIQKLQQKQKKGQKTHPKSDQNVSEKKKMSF